MRTRPRWWPAAGLAFLLLLLVVPSFVSAATSVRTFTASPYSTFHPTLRAAPPVTVGAHAVVRFGFAPGYAAAGVQGSSPGLQGTTVVLASCAVACTDRYRPASSAAIAARDYTERTTFTVTQPVHTGTPVGFGLEVAVDLTTGWVVGFGYFSTGVATGATTATITLQFYVDLGTAAPTVTAVEVTVNLCGSTTGCP